MNRITVERKRDAYVKALLWLRFKCVRPLGERMSGGTGWITPSSVGMFEVEGCCIFRYERLIRAGEPARIGSRRGRV